MGSGAFDLVWPTAIVYGATSLINSRRLDASVRIRNGHTLTFIESTFGMQSEIINNKSSKFL